MFPSENDFIARHDFAILALDRYLFALAVNHVPTELPADPRFGDQLACPDPNRAKPFFQLSRVGPCGVHPGARRVDKSLDLKRSVFCRFGRHYFDDLSTNCLSSVSTIAVHPVSKFCRAYAGVRGNVSIPVCVSLSRVFSPSGRSSNVTNESPGSPL